MLIWKRVRRIRRSHADDIASAREVAAESTRQANEDLENQRALLHHERQTVTHPLRDERVKVNHLSILAQNALWGK